MKIVVIDGFTLNPGDNPWSDVEKLGELKVYDRTPADQVLARAKGADILLANKTPLPANLIENLPDLKLICVLATGVNIIDTAAARARSVARAFLADPYLHLRNYTNNLRRHGYEDQDFEHDGSDRLVDALVLHGTLDHIVAGLNDHIEAGADHVAVQVLEAAGTVDPLPAYRALAHALGV